MARLKAVAVPLALAVVIGGAAVAFLAMKELPPMALLHVVGMAAAFLIAAPVGALVQKVPGNTSVHATGMAAGALIGPFGPSHLGAHSVILCCCGPPRTGPPTRARRASRRLLACAAFGAPISARGWLPQPSSFTSATR